MSVVNLSCDLKQAVRVQHLDGNFFTGDSGNTINVSVYEDGQPVSLSGSVGAYVIKSDGSTQTVSGGSVSGNVASLTLPDTAMNVPGKVSIAIRLTATDYALTLAALVANIYG